MTERDDIRLALPSKGRLADDTLDLLRSAGLAVRKRNPRQYEASMPAIPGLMVIFQRAGDIATAVTDGVMDLGVTGLDMVAERASGDDVIVLLDSLGYGYCTLNVIVPETYEAINTMRDLAAWQQSLGRRLRIATKFPVASRAFLARQGFDDVEIISAEGTLEIAPTVGYADVIVDLVSTGVTLRDNRLKQLVDGEVLASQACLIANKHQLRQRPDVLAAATQLLEFIVAHKRATENVAVFANMRGDSPEQVATRMFSQEVIRGLQGPTVSPVVAHAGDSWYAVHLVVRKDQLSKAITELRSVGGSGVVVTPVSFIFEEQPDAVLAMMAAVNGNPEAVSDA